MVVITLIHLQGVPKPRLGMYIWTSSYGTYYLESGVRNISPKKVVFQGFVLQHNPIKPRPERRQGATLKWSNSLRINWEFLSPQLPGMCRSSAFLRGICPCSGMMRMQRKQYTTQRRKGKEENPLQKQQPSNGVSKMNYENSPEQPQQHLGNNKHARARWQ